MRAFTILVNYFYPSGGSQLTSDTFDDGSSQESPSRDLPGLRFGPFPLKKRVSCQIWIYVPEAYTWSGSYDETLEI